MESLEDVVMRICKETVMEHLESYDVLKESGVPTEAILSLMKQNIPALFDNVIKKKIKEEL